MKRVLKPYFSVEYTPNHLGMVLNADSDLIDLVWA